MTALQSICYRITQYEWLILLAIFPIIIFLTPKTAPILIIIPIFWLIRRIAIGRFFPPTPVTFPLTLLLMMALISLVSTFNLKDSLPMAGSLTLERQDQL